MTLTIHDDKVPLRVDTGSDIRVGQSNVLFEFVIAQFEEGNSPEEIADAYDTLNVADVYAVIAYFLRRRDEVKAYMDKRDGEIEELKLRIEARQLPRPDFREELLARRGLLKTQDAASGHR